MVRANPTVFDLLTLGGELLKKLTSSKGTVIGDIFTYNNALIVGPIFELLFSLNGFSGCDTYLMSDVQKARRMIYKYTTSFVRR